MSHDAAIVSSLLSFLMSLLVCGGPFRSPYSWVAPTIKKHFSVDNLHGRGSSRHPGEASLSALSSEGMCLEQGGEEILAPEGLTIALNHNGRFHYVPDLWCAPNFKRSARLIYLSMLSFGSLKKKIKRNSSQDRTPRKDLATSIIAIMDYTTSSGRPPK